MLYPTTVETLGAQPIVTECEATTPLPVNGILMGEADVLLVRETAPLTVPGPDGAKLTANVTYWPGPTVTPDPIPEVAKPAPVTEFCCTVSGIPPVLENVTPSVELLPTATSPKSTFELYTVKIAGDGSAAAPPAPQPAAAKTPARRPMINQLYLLFIVNFPYRPPAYASKPAKSSQELTIDSLKSPQFALGLPAFIQHAQHSDRGPVERGKNNLLRQRGS